MEECRRRWFNKNYEIRNLDDIEVDAAATRVSPEFRLWWEVLCLAIHDYSSTVKKERDDAREWIYGTGVDSLAWVTDHLFEDGERIRLAIIGRLEARDESGWVNVRIKKAYDPDINPYCPKKSIVGGSK